MHQNSAAGFAIAAGAADFLIIRFQAAGQRGVNDSADIRFVDSHAERDSRNHNFDAAVQKLLLHALALRRFQAGMIGGTREMGPQFGGQSRGLGARGRVYNGRPASGVLQQFAGELGS